MKATVQIQERALNLRNNYFLRFVEKINIPVKFSIFSFQAKENELIFLVSAKKNQNDFEYQIVTYNFALTSLKKIDLKGLRTNRFASLCLISKDFILCSGVTKKESSGLFCLDLKSNTIKPFAACINGNDLGGLVIKRITDNIFVLDIFYHKLYKLDIEGKEICNINLSGEGFFFPLALEGLGRNQVIISCGQLSSLHKWSKYFPEKLKISPFNFVVWNHERNTFTPLKFEGISDSSFQDFIQSDNDYFAIQKTTLIKLSSSFQVLFTASLKDLFKGIGIGVKLGSIRLATYKNKLFILNRLKSGENECYVFKTGEEV